MADTVLQVRRVFRVTLICDGLPASAGEEAAKDVTKEFAESRQWHSRVTCDWDGSRWILRSENDFDETGQATLDEFGDCVAAYVTEYEGSSIRIESVSEFDHENAQHRIRLGRKTSNPFSF